MSVFTHGIKAIIWLRVVVPDETFPFMITVDNPFASDHVPWIRSVLHVTDCIQLAIISDGFV
jgi:hypothetical protein